MSPHRLGIVADDLTGAADSAVPFAEAGWPVHLLLHRPAAEPTGPAVLAIVTGARALDDQAAAARTGAAVQELIDLGCDRVYVKVDSTMRGSVAGQLRGALGAWSTLHPDALVVLCPAFCAQKRVVLDGEVLVDGVPLDQSAAAHDPVTPVHESHLARLVPGARPLTADPSPGRIYFADAATDTDLDTLAVDLERCGPSLVLAGSAGWAHAYARRWGQAPRPGPGPSAPPADTGASCPASLSGTDTTAAPPVLVAVSSLHPVAARAVTRLRAEEPTVDIVTTSTQAAPSATHAAADFAGNIVLNLHQKTYQALVLVGGDGAAAALESLDATAVSLHRYLLPGVPVGTITGGIADGLRIVTRSGGFGDDAGLTRIVRLLQHPH